MDEPAATMVGVEGLEDWMSSSSVMEDSRALGIDAVGGGHLEEEQQISHNTMSDTIGAENIGTISHTSGSVEIQGPDEEVVHRAGQNFITPEVGMTFESEEKAYNMYNTYVGKVGFSVRKSKMKRRQDGSICQKYLVCSSQGHQKNESSEKDITRTGCEARV